MKKLILKRTKNGKGVFAGKNFREGEMVCEFRGKLFIDNGKTALPADINIKNNHYLQIGEKVYMGPSGKIDDYFNHSCDPNSGLIFKGRKVYLKAIKIIKSGDEVTWDYSTTMDEDDWEMDCACKSKICRKKIRDFKYLPADRQKFYTNLGIAPAFIIKKYKN